MAHIEEGRMSLWTQYTVSKNDNVVCSYRIIIAPFKSKTWEDRLHLKIITLKEPTVVLIKPKKDQKPTLLSIKSNTIARPEKVNIALLRSYEIMTVCNITSFIALLFCFVLFLLWFLLNKETHTLIIK